MVGWFPIRGGRPQTHRVDSEAIVGSQPEQSDYEEVISHVYRVGNRLTMAPYTAELQINGTDGN